MHASSRPRRMTRTLPARPVHLMSTQGRSPSAPRLGVGPGAVRKATAPSATRTTCPCPCLGCTQPHRHVWRASATDSTVSAASAAPATRARVRVGTNTTPSSRASVPRQLPARSTALWPRMCSNASACQAGLRGALGRRHSRHNELGLPVFVSWPTSLCSLSTLTIIQAAASTHPYRRGGPTPRGLTDSSTPT